MIFAVDSVVKQAVITFRLVTAPFRWTTAATVHAVAGFILLENVAREWNSFLMPIRLRSCENVIM